MQIDLRIINNNWTSCCVKIGLLKTAISCIFLCWWWQGSLNGSVLRSLTQPVTTLSLSWYKTNRQSGAFVHFSSMLCLRTCFYFIVSAQHLSGTNSISKWLNKKLLPNLIFVHTWKKNIFWKETILFWDRDEHCRGPQPCLEL